MADNAAQPRDQRKNMANWKPGSESGEAKDVAAPGDFGVPVGSGPSRERDYVNENTRRSDPGVSQPADWEEIGVRDHGAGAPASGPGSSSAGDLDPDIVGVGTGGTGVAQSAPDDSPGPDDVTDATDAFASGTPANVRPGGSAREPRAPRSRGNSINGDLDMQNGSGGRGADAATNPARGDDSFAGEISSGEARGDDLPFDEPPDAQGGSDEGEI